MEPVPQLLLIRFIHRAPQAQRRMVLESGAGACLAFCWKRKSSGGSEHCGPRPLSRRHRCWASHLLADCPELLSEEERPPLLGLFAGKLRVQGQASPLGSPGVKGPWRITSSQRGRGLQTRAGLAQRVAQRTGYGGLLYHAALPKQRRIPFLFLAKHSQICNCQSELLISLR